MKTFLEYLYRSGKVEAVALARAQVEQLAKLRTALEIVQAENLIAPADLIEALLVQEEKSISFKEACFQAGLWNETVSSAVAAAQAKERIPLLDLLLAQGALSREELTTLHLSFTGALAEPTLSAPAAPAPTVATASSSCPLTGDSLIDESLQTAWGLLQIEADAGACVHAFHRLKGALRFRGPNSAERWADFGEQAFRLSGALGATFLAECRPAGMAALRAVAAEANPAAPRLDNSQKEGLVAFLQKLRMETDRKKKDAA